jgi:hypothetical protein
VRGRGEARTDRTGLLRAIGRLLVGRNALPENPIHNTLGGKTSTSETPDAICNLFMALLSGTRADRLCNVGCKTRHLSGLFCHRKQTA